MIPREIFVPTLAVLILAIVWVFRDARARDANPALWVAGLTIGALFGFWEIIPVGLLIYVLVRPKGRLERCPSCGAGHLYWLAECPKCESPLKKECSRCREPVPITAARCPECGAQL